MIRPISILLVCCALLRLSRAEPSWALEAGDAPSMTLWTAIIPDAFPQYVYTWRMNPDGTYREDGRDASMGTPIQPTLSGRWSREGPQMVLRQDGLAYVFDGVVLGNLYAGTLTLNGRPVSGFCAAKGDLPPQHCDPKPGVALAVNPGSGDRRSDYAAFLSMLTANHLR